MRVSRRPADTRLLADVSPHMILHNLARAVFDWQGRVGDDARIFSLRLLRRSEARLFLVFYLFNNVKPRGKGPGFCSPLVAVVQVRLEGVHLGEQHVHRSVGAGGGRLHGHACAGAGQPRHGLLRGQVPRAHLVGNQVQVARVEHLAGAGGLQVALPERLLRGHGRAELYHHGLELLVQADGVGRGEQAVDRQHHVGGAAGLLCKLQRLEQLLLGAAGLHDGAHFLLHLRHEELPLLEPHVVCHRHRHLLENRVRGVHAGAHRVAHAHVHAHVHAHAATERIDGGHAPRCHLHLLLLLQRLHLRRLLLRAVPVVHQSQEAADHALRVGL
mmetsp:Transcript_14052/g.30046  ORF Transcript_14052/g.30046 Transcript_14052/m.30046 type:complete len:329 (-) Transcript_14052:1084-2070(-)